MGAIIGGTVAAVLVVLLLGATAGWLLYQRRERMRAQSRPRVDLTERDEERKGFIAPYPGTPPAHFVSATATESHDSLPEDKPPFAPTGSNPLKRPLVVLAAEEDDAEKVGQSSGGAPVRAELDRMRADIENIKLNVAPPRYNP